MGNAELSRLWNLSLTEETLVDPKKGGMPDLKEFLEPVRQDMDPSAGIEEEYKHKHNKVFILFTGLIFRFIRGRLCD